MWRSTVNVILQVVVDLQFFRSWIGRLGLSTVSLLQEWFQIFSRISPRDCNQRFNKNNSRFSPVKGALIHGKQRVLCFDFRNVLQPIQFGALSLRSHTKSSLLLWAAIKQNPQQCCHYLRLQHAIWNHCNNSASIPSHEKSGLQESEPCYKNLNTWR